MRLLVSLVKLLVLFVNYKGDQKAQLRYSIDQVKTNVEPSKVFDLSKYIVGVFLLILRHLDLNSLYHRKK